MEAHEKIQFPNRTLKAENLACRRGGRTVFEGLRFELEAGACLHLKGNNGSGKSTLLRLLAGLLPALQGSVMSGGLSLQGAEAARSGLMIYSGHKHGLKNILTLQENCAAFHKLMTGDPLSGAVLERAAVTFGLRDLVDQPLQYFSSGQTHRCALLRFLLIDRQIWLMDEPTVGLDSENRQRLEAVMQSHLKRGGVIVAASHDPLGIPVQALDLADFTAGSSHLEHWL